MITAINRHLGPDETLLIRVAARRAQAHVRFKRLKGTPAASAAMVMLCGWDAKLIALQQRRAPLPLVTDQDRAFAVDQAQRYIAQRRREKYDAAQARRDRLVGWALRVALVVLPLCLAALLAYEIARPFMFESALHGAGSQKPAVEREHATTGVEPAAGAHSTGARP